ncbi:MAG: hypothetical protein IKE35_02500 [Lachnospiraceae bacterium]|nr:hypothetical protein [Lachnospiraceae bacterium]
MPDTVKRKEKRRKRADEERYEKTVVRRLLLCFPAGILNMWSRLCRWHIALKILITVFIAAFVVAVCLPQTMPPERAEGGVTLIRSDESDEVQGPVRQPDEYGEYEVYVPVYVPQSTLVAEPTPTPVPIYVWANDGGKYYHNRNCRYVKKTTPRVTLAQAVRAGFLRCKVCNPPSEEELY